MADKTIETGQIRLDKWLWHARFFRSRTIAADVCKGRKVRVNGSIVSKAATNVKPGDTLTFPQANDVRVVRIVACGSRRGPAEEAQGLYEDLSPPKPKGAESDPENMDVAARDRGAGRPTKAERRAIDKLMGKGMPDDD